jgi:hypothetical protein
LLRDYTLEDAPLHVIEDINDGPIVCECGTTFEIVVRLKIEAITREVI